MGDKASDKENSHESSSSTTTKDPNKVNAWVKVRFELLNGAPLYFVDPKFQLSDNQTDILNKYFQCNNVSNSRWYQYMDEVKKETQRECIDEFHSYFKELEKNGIDTQMCAKKFFQKSKDIWVFKEWIRDTSEYVNNSESEFKKLEKMGIDPQICTKYILEEYENIAIFIEFFTDFYKLIQKLENIGIDTKRIFQDSKDFKTFRHKYSVAYYRVLALKEQILRHDITKYENPEVRWSSVINNAIIVNKGNDLIKKCLNQKCIVLLKRVIVHDDSEKCQDTAKNQASNNIRNDLSRTKTNDNRKEERKRKRETSDSRINDDISKNNVKERSQKKRKIEKAIFDASNGNCEDTDELMKNSIVPLKIAPKISEKNSMIDKNEIQYKASDVSSKNKLSNMHGNITYNLNEQISSERKLKKSNEKTERNSRSKIIKRGGSVEILDSRKKDDTSIENVEKQNSQKKSKVEKSNEKPNFNVTADLSREIIKHNDKLRNTYMKQNYTCPLKITEKNSMIDKNETLRKACSVSNENKLSNINGKTVDNQNEGENRQKKTKDSIEIFDSSSKDNLSKENVEQNIQKKSELEEIGKADGSKNFEDSNEVIDNKNKEKSSQKKGKTENFDENTEFNNKCNSCKKNNWELVKENLKQKHEVPAEREATKNAMTDRSLENQTRNKSPNNDQNNVSIAIINNQFEGNCLKKRKIKKIKVKAYSNYKDDENKCLNEQKSKAINSKCIVLLEKLDEPKAEKYSMNDETKDKMHQVSTENESHVDKSRHVQILKKKDSYCHKDERSKENIKGMQIKECLEKKCIVLLEKISSKSIVNTSVDTHPVSNKILSSTSINQKEKSFQKIDHTFQFSGSINQKSKIRRRKINRVNNRIISRIIHKSKKVLASKNKLKNNCEQKNNQNINNQVAQVTIEENSEINSGDIDISLNNILDKVVEVEENLKIVPREIVISVKNILEEIIQLEKKTNKINADIKVNNKNIVEEVPIEENSNVQIDEILGDAYANIPGTSEVYCTEIYPTHIIPQKLDYFDDNGQFTFCEELDGKVISAKNELDLLYADGVTLNDPAYIISPFDEFPNVINSDQTPSNESLEELCENIILETIELLPQEQLSLYSAFDQSNGWIIPYAFGH